MNKICGIAGILLVTTTFAHAGVVAPAEVAYDGIAVPMSLTGVPGDPENGRKVFMNRELGNCLACHQNSDMADQLFHGEIGPSLDGVAERYSEAELRGILVDSKAVFDGTIMPAFYVADRFTRNLKKFEGKTILSAQDVEDLIAYLQTLKN